MRLFISINFNSLVKSKLEMIRESLKKYSSCGNFTRIENFHLTLVFLGEVEKGRLDEIKRVMNYINIENFIINLCGIGCFKRNGGDIWWVGLDENKTLQNLYNELNNGLSKSGFELENRKFTPHLTLAREVKVNKNFNKEILSKDISKIHFAVDEINLMKSERIAGKLTYTSIYKKVLKQNKNQNEM